MNKIVVIVQARMGSTRLPGKILKELCGKPLLAHDLERLQRARSPHEVMVATSYLGQDDPVFSLCRKLGVRCFRGDEDHVLSRYYGAAQMAAADIIVRVTSDCPLIDPDTLDEVVTQFLHDRCDYLATPIPDRYPRGVDVEVLTFAALQKVMRIAQPGPDCEHVTYGLYTRPQQFRIGNFAGREPLLRPQYRLCVDTCEDFQLIEEIYRRLYRPGSIIDITDVVTLLDTHPELVAINANIAQKHV